MSDESEWNPVDHARWSTEFFAPRVPGQLGCVFDHSAKDLVIGHIDVTENLIAGTGFLFAPAVIALADTCVAIGCGNNTRLGRHGHQRGQRAHDGAVSMHADDPRVQMTVDAAATRSECF